MNVTNALFWFWASGIWYIEMSTDSRPFSAMLEMYKLIATYLTCNLHGFYLWRILKNEIQHFPISMIIASLNYSEKAQSEHKH